MNVEVNVDRIKYLMKIFNLTKDDFISMLSKGLKKNLTDKDILASNIKLSVLKKMDKIFEKGINFYLNPYPIEINKETSIFFRKDGFSLPINLGARRIISSFEDKKNLLLSYSRLSNLKIRRILPIYSIGDNPYKVAQEVLETFSLNKGNVNKDSKLFLKNFINELSDRNVYVFEFIETWNKKETANISGFFLNPNVIVLKRLQHSFKREIFSLAHELGHYLLDFEDVDDSEKNIDNNINEVETWCNDFAFAFIVGDYMKLFDCLDNASPSNDFHDNLCGELTKYTAISAYAIYTHLLRIKKISYVDYKTIVDDLKRNYMERQAISKLKPKVQLDGRKGSAPKPIQSPLYIYTLRNALFDGIINEYDFCKQLNVKSDKIMKYL
jgi:Zn-dependent peptidase ImmA (M78 family)